MSGFEPRALIRWAIQRANTDSVLPGLIATGQAWEVLPRKADTTAKPGLVFGIQSTLPPTGALRSGSRTWTEQTCIMRAQASQQTFSREQIEAVESQLLVLFDGVFSQDLSDPGTLWHCLFLQQMPDVVEPLGDQQTVTGTLWFEASLKVSA